MTRTPREAVEAFDLEASDELTAKYVLFLSLVHLRNLGLTKGAGEPYVGHVENGRRALTRLRNDNVDRPLFLQLLDEVLSFVEGAASRGDWDDVTWAMEQMHNVPHVWTGEVAWSDEFFFDSFVDERAMETFPTLLELQKLLCR